MAAELISFGIDSQRADQLLRHYLNQTGVDPSPGAVRARMLTDYIYHSPWAGPLRPSTGRAPAGSGS